MDFKWLKVSDYEKDILYRYVLDGVNHDIKVNDFPEFQYVADYEGGEAYLDWSNKIVFGFVSWASGQGGIVFVWDIYHNKVIHVGENEFVVKLLLYGNRLFALSDVCYYGHRAELMLSYADIIPNERELKWTVINVPYTESSLGSSNYLLEIKSNRLYFGNPSTNEFNEDKLVSVELPPDLK